MRNVLFAVMAFWSSELLGEEFKLPANTALGSECSEYQEYISLKELKFAFVGSVLNKRILAKGSGADDLLYTIDVQRSIVGKLPEKDAILFRTRSMESLGKYAAKLNVESRYFFYFNRDRNRQNVGLAFWGDDRNVVEVKGDISFSDLLKKKEAIDSGNFNLPKNYNDCFQKSRKTLSPKK